MKLKKEEFLDCLKIIHDNPAVNYHLGLAYNKKQNFQKAKIFLAKALKLSKNFDGAKEAEQLLKELNNA